MEKLRPLSFQIFTVSPECIYDVIKIGDLQSLSAYIANRWVPPKIELNKAFTLAMPYPAIFKTLLDTYRCNDIEILGDVLQYAAQNNNHAIITLLLEYFERDDIHLPVYSELLKKHPREMATQQINSGMTLIYACENGHIDALKVLLKKESICQFATWCENAALQITQQKKKQAETEEQKMRYNQVIGELTNVSDVAKLARANGEIFAKLDHHEVDKPPILIKFHNISPRTSTDDFHSDEEPETPSNQGSCRIS